MQPTTLRFFQLHNPFYLLSALCMLAGCYGLVQSLRMAPGHTETLIGLMAVVQLYELLLVGLAWSLIAKRGAERDGRMLLLLELVFLVDATYLNAEFSAADPQGGALVGLVTLALVFVKVGVMLHALGLRFGLKAHSFLLVQFGALLGIPLLSAKMFAQSLLSETFFYAVWCLVGILPLVLHWMLEELESRSLPDNWLRPLERNLRIAFILFPFASAVLHAASMHWVYGFPFYGSYLTPVVLGLGVSLPLMGQRWLSRQWCYRFRWLIPLGAIMLSTRFPAELLFTLPWEGFENVIFSPLRTGLLAAAVIYSLSFWLYRWRPFLSAAASAFLFAAAGYSISSIVGNIVYAAHSVIPRSAIEWCLMAIVGAFVFLALGAAVSYSNHARPTERPRSL